jgi:plastocyanin
MPRKDVEIKNFAYSPDPVVINVGDSVRWINKDGVTHTATREDAPAFDTGGLAQNESRTVEFNQASSSAGFEYFCKPHQTMKGRVKVLSRVTPSLDQPADVV